MPRALPAPVAIALLLLASSCLARAGAAAHPLDDQSSPYLRDHAGDAIVWRPWTDAALARAKKENKPIYVCVGSFTSELSRAMHQQSFANPQVAEALNRDFICILVDRDERSDLAALFQSYVQANQQLTGWPTNLWLTPDLQPFEGATYLPPSEEWGKEGVVNVVKRVAAAWQTAPDALRQKAKEGVATAVAAETWELGPKYSAAAVEQGLTKATASWLEHYDQAHGGFGDSPRFAEPELLRFLLRTAGPGRDAALATLHAIDQGALHDALDGGFFHKTVDAAWTFPSFQKQLGDQARLALAFLDAARLSKDPGWARAARSALDYGLSRLAAPKGGWIHAEDATPEPLTAAFAWTQEDLTHALGGKDAAAFASAFGVKAEGNIATENDPSGKWKGRNLLVGHAAPSEGSKQADWSAARAKLLAIRDGRPRALRDEAVLLGENGLWLSALARAGQQLQEKRYSEVATQLASYLERAIQGGEKTTWPRMAGGTAPAAADDYAYVALGLGALGATAKEKKPDARAGQLLEEQAARFLDLKTGRFYAQSSEAPVLWLRPHLLDPSAGEPPSAETATLLAYLSLGQKKDSIPVPLLRSLTAALNDPSGQPRGDVLLAAAQLVDAP